jgi:hypothetical protein
MVIAGVQLPFLDSEATCSEPPFDYLVGEREQVGLNFAPSAWFGSDCPSEAWLAPSAPSDNPETVSMRAGRRRTVSSRARRPSQNRWPLPGGLVDMRCHARTGTLPGTLNTAYGHTDQSDYSRLVFLPIRCRPPHWRFRSQHALSNWSAASPHNRLRARKSEEQACVSSLL